MFRIQFTITIDLSHCIGTIGKHACRKRYCENEKDTEQSEYVVICVSVPQQYSIRYSEITKDKNYIKIIVLELSNCIYT